MAERPRRKIQDVPIGGFIVSPEYPEVVMRRVAAVDGSDSVMTTVMTYSAHGHEPGNPWYFNYDTTVYYPVTAKEEAHAREDALKRLTRLSEALGFEL